MLYARGSFDPLDVQSWTIQFGGTPAQGDYDGDGRADPAVRTFLGGTTQWQVRMSTTNVTTVTFDGSVNDVMAQTDLDGDGQTDIVVFRPREGRWIRYPNGTSYSWGLWGDGPAVTGAANNAAAVVRARNDLRRATDFDGDSLPDLTVYRPDTGQWHALSRAGLTTARPGRDSVEIAAAGDYDGDGTTDPAVCGLSMEPACPA